ncbi:hypothetical protein [Pleomorphomonas sp. JP5]|uniref:hypothetical protein n=1 Tax=Pleomorphomonas sp. JP5 TaxID=2942998 RepID=UPI0020434999|nr:hypothetical protein [Pleomorphomonas sp. JP5]MCM5556168.1 hypothetical protein [Pleomorphomonas sp. JP5]
MRRVVALGALALLAGCVSSPVPVVYKAGSSFADRQAAADQCRIESLEKIPQAMVTVIRPPEYRPGFTECREDPESGRRYCRRTGGFVYPGSSHTKDVNAELRERYIGGCLRRAGYEVIAKPICGDDAGAAYMAGRDNQAPAASLACVTEDERVIPRDWR